MKNLDKVKKQLLFLAGVLGVSLCASVAAAGSKSVPASAASRINVGTSSADVRIVAWEKDELQAQASDGTPQVDVSGAQLSVGAPDADLVLHVPAGARVSVQTLSGDVKVQGVTGALHVRSMSGELLVEGAGGEVEAQAVSGNVRVIGGKGSVQARSVSGNVTLRDCAGRVAGRSVSGKIHATGLRGTRVRLNSHSGNVKMQGTVASDGSLAAKSFSGNVELSLEQADFTLSARSRHGAVAVSVPLQGREQSTSRVSGRAGQGGAELKLSTYSGNISVQAKK